MLLFKLPLGLALPWRGVRGSKFFPFFCLNDTFLVDLKAMAGWLAHRLESGPSGVSNSSTMEFRYSLPLKRRLEEVDRLFSLNLVSELFGVKSNLGLISDRSSAQHREPIISYSI